MSHKYKFERIVAMLVLLLAGWASGLPSAAATTRTSRSGSNQWKAYYSNSETGWQNVMVWVWDQMTPENNYTGGTWPGAQCTKETIDGEEYWTYTFETDDDIEQPMIIFNDGTGWGYQTADLEFINDGIYNYWGFTGNRMVDGKVNGVERHDLTLVSEPVGASSLYGAGRYGYGTSVYAETYPNSGYVFQGWMKDGETVSSDRYYSFTMPDEDVVLTAKYVFDPASPADPDSPKVRYPLNVRVQPAGAASVSVSSNLVNEGDPFTVYAYPNAGYRLTKVIINGVQAPVSEEELNRYSTYYYDGTMIEGGFEIVGVYRFDPTSPSNPGANHFNSETGEVIIDDFTQGDLYSAISKCVGYDNFDKVSSIVVKGRMSSSDYGTLSYLKNAAVIDLSRVGGTNEIPSWAFNGLNVSSIILPSTITSIGGYCFYDCPNLTSLTIYAQEPPQVSYSTFSGLDVAACTLFVPASAIELYSAAEYWKDFSILPINSDAHALQVALPADGADGRYKNYSLEIVNRVSGVRQKYIVSDRMTYVFNGLQKNEMYDVFLYSPAGMEVGRIEGLVIPDKDLEVTFSNLKSLHSVFAKVTTPDGAEVTDRVAVEWLRPNGDDAPVYMRKGASLGEIPEGQQLICRVTLDETLGIGYRNPADVLFTVGDGNEVCAVTLEPFRSVVLSGTVVDGDGQPLSGASVSVSQTLNGRFTKTFTAKTDRKGAWSLNVLDAPETLLTYAASECVNVNQLLEAFDPEIEALDLGKVTLKSIVGARINYSFTYHEAGEEEQAPFYEDYQNVTVDVFNVTQNRAHPEVSMQYPVLAVLDENIAAGDELRLTASSKKGAFNPVVETVTVGENQRGEVVFDIVGKGGVAASFEMTDNPSVIAMLYSDKGELLKKQTYSEAKTKFTGLEDGDYTLVTMGRSDLMNSILRLSSFGEVGLSEGKDYVKNAVKVKSGELTEVTIPEVPAFDESLFYYTGSNTSFTVNKSSITTGNYLTLRSAIDFKGIYRDGVSNVALVVDLPEACDFVEQSVIQGPNLLPYTLDNNRLTIQLGDTYATQTRFCVVPTAGGEFTATASITFDCDGKSVTQPIGSALSTVKDLEISVPSVLTSESFYVNGVAPANSNVAIYDNGSLIGNGRTLANGTWAAECTLPSTYNLSEHTIYAVVTTQSGSQLRTESASVEFDRNNVQPINVHMTFYNSWLGRNVNVNFDFQNLTIDNPNYMFYTTTEFTFVADFTENDPEKLSDVVLWTLCSDNSEIAIPMSYDEQKGKWIAVHSFDYYNAPRNLALEFTAMGEKVFDRRQLSDHYAESDSLIKDNLVERAQFIEAYDSKSQPDEIRIQLNALFEQEEPDEDEISRLLAMLPYGEVDIVVDTEDFDEDDEDIEDEEFDEWLRQSDAEFDEIIRQTDTSWEKWEGETSPEIRERILGDCFVDPNIDIDSDLRFETAMDEGLRISSKQKLASVDIPELEAAGFSPMVLDDGSKIYVLYDEDRIEVVDCQALLRYSVVIERTMSSEASKARLSAISNYLRHAEHAKATMKRLMNLPTEDRRRWLVEIIEGVGDIANDLALFYNEFMSDLIDKLADIYQGLDVLSDKEIQDQEKLLRKSNERVANCKAKIEKNIAKRNSLKEKRQSVINSETLSPEEKAKRIANYDKKIEKLTADNKKLNGKRLAASNAAGRAETRLADIKQNSSLFRKAHTKIRETLSSFPTKLTKGMRIPKLLKVCGRIAGELGLPLQCWSLYNDVIDFGDDMGDWISLMDMIDINKCYVKKDPPAVSLHGDIYDSAYSRGKQHLGILSGNLLSIAFSAVGAIPGSPTWWIEMGLGVATEWWKFFNNNGSIDDRVRYWQAIGKLKCDEKDDDKDKDKDKKRKKQIYPFQEMSPIHDPSGFVYEAVPANRVEGVQASIYYKETKEDMYGDLYDDIVLWDAEEYAQKNPLFTDDKGMYQWDVPQGLWQVKFEKEGYETTFSEWLPVPPPQLEVNIGIVQNKQPEVIEARAYETGVEVQFDKFMDLSTLNADNIFVTADGEKLSGEVSLVDSELADEYASEEDADALRFASRVRFVPEQPLGAATGEIRLTVSRNVLSYAGLPMAETYSQPLDVEKEIQALYADDVKVLYGDEKEVTLFALPYDAAAGRTMRVTSSSDLILSVEPAEVVLDDEGKGVVKVRGDLPGRAMLTLSIDDVTATGDVTVDVVTEIITAEAPKASRASGTAVYRGTKVELTTDSKNAVIYFTTDGSCPCDENGTRRKYSVPIVIDRDTKILAMTVVGNGSEEVSETVEFNYTLKRAELDMRMEEGWNWISHNMESPVAVSDLTADAAVDCVMSQTDEMIRDPQLGWVGTLTQLVAPESYKIHSSAATARQRLSDIAWNPATPVALHAGWNWLGYPADKVMTLDDAFAATEVETLDVLVGQNGFAQYDGERWVGTLETLVPGTGYLYQSRSAKNVVYNTSAVSAASRAASSDKTESLFMADSRKYAKVMPMTAVLTSAEGAPLDNADYQVAAFCGSECRGVGRLVDGRFMMNVYGEKEDPIAFVVTDLDGEKTFVTDAEIAFSERVVGDLFEPFALQVKGVSGVADVKAESRIKVTVENDVLRVSGVAASAIDLLEIYDLDGMKLTRTTAVADSGVKVDRLAGGVYIVVVVVDGEYTYHKLAW